MSARMLTPAAIEAVARYHDKEAAHYCGQMREAKPGSVEQGFAQKLMHRHLHLAGALRRHGRPVNGRTLEPADL